MSSKNIKVSTDKIIFNYRLKHYFLQYKNLKIETPLQFYNFSKIPSSFLGFIRGKKKRLYAVKDKDNPKLKYTYEYQYTYKHSNGCEIKFRWKQPRGPLACIAIEFIPTIKNNFNYSFIVEVFNQLHLDHRDFSPSNFEIAFDDYNESPIVKSKKIWTRTDDYFYFYTDATGQRIEVSDPTLIPEGIEYTTYAGEKKNALQVKNYWKAEFDKKFLRTEISICQKTFKRSKVNHLDDLMFNYSRPLKTAFKSFKLAKLKRDKITADLGVPARFFNKYKDLPAKHKAKLIYDLHKDKFNNFEQFRKKYVEFYSLTDDLHEMSLDYFKNTFFAVDPFLRKEIKKQRTLDLEQRKVERKIRKKFLGSVGEAKKKAWEYLDASLLDRVRGRILHEIEQLVLKPENKEVGYQGILDGLIFGLDRVAVLIKKEKRQELTFEEEEYLLNDDEIDM
jgi:hypothetical protein